jgi:hypothetical protein
MSEHRNALGFCRTCGSRRGFPATTQCGKCAHTPRYGVCGGPSAEDSAKKAQVTASQFRADHGQVPGGAAHFAPWVTDQVVEEPTDVDSDADTIVPAPQPDDCRRRKPVGYYRPRPLNRLPARPASPPAVPQDVRIQWPTLTQWLNILALNLLFRFLPCASGAMLDRTSDPASARWLPVIYFA